MNLATPCRNETVTPDQTDLRVWFKNHVDSRFSLADSMINYLSRMLDQTGYTTSDLLDLRITADDPKDHEHDPGDRQPLYYYVLRVPASRTKAGTPTDLPPETPRAVPARGLSTIEHEMITHTSNIG